MSADNKPMAVDVKTDSGLEADTPKALFEVRLKSRPAGNTTSPPTGNASWPTRPSAR